MPRADRPRNSTRTRNRRERARLLKARDRVGNRMRHAATTIEREEKRIAALAVELAEVDRRMLELGAPEAGR